MSRGTVFAGARFEPVPGGPAAEAMAVVAGRVAAAGTRDEARAVAGREAEEVDLGGGVVRPGFHDAHTHLSAGALDAFVRVDLKGAGSAGEAAALAAERGSALPSGAWVRGFGWDQTRWPGARWPERTELDAVLPDRPAFLVRVDGHAAWLNGAALAALGLGADAPGILLEEAMERARAALPEDAPALRREALTRALQAAASLGIVAVDDVVEPWAPEVYAALLGEEALPLRANLWLPGDLDEAAAQALRRAHPPGSSMLAMGTRKLFLDGTLGSRSAALRAPYADAPETCGELRFTDRELHARVAELVSQGWSLALHAIGDAAVDQAARALLEGGGGGRHRVEHLQVVAPDTLPHLARSGAGASVQPVHFLEDAPWIEARLSPRAALLYPWRSLQAAGIPLAFGTDWPIAPLDPRLGLAAAAGRQGEGLSEAQAWSAYTRGSATIAGWEFPRGTLHPGAFADFVLWDPEGKRVRATWVGGRQIS